MEPKKMMRDVYDMFILQSTSKGLKLTIEIAPNVPQIVISDERRLKQVIINLLSNSLKFTNEGSITIEVEFDTDTNKLFFSIIDTGIGIRKVDQVKLFKMFGKLQSSQNCNQQGIGLGLSVCKRIINVFQGDLNVTSELTKGSKFSFSFTVTGYTMKKAESRSGTPQRENELPPIEEQPEVPEGSDDRSE